MLFPLYWIPQNRNLAMETKLITCFFSPLRENMFDIEWAADQVGVLTYRPYLTYRTNHIYQRHCYLLGLFLGSSVSIKLLWLLFPNWLMARVICEYWTSSFFATHNSASRSMISSVATHFKLSSSKLWLHVVCVPLLDGERKKSKALC